MELSSLHPVPCLENGILALVQLKGNRPWRIRGTLLGQGDDDLQELLEDQDPQELEAFYRQWQAEDQDSIEFSQWLEDQWAFVV